MKYTLILLLFLTSCTKEPVIVTPRLDDALKEAVPLHDFRGTCLGKALWQWELPGIYGTHEDINGFPRDADSILYNFFIAVEKRDDCDSWTQPLGTTWPEPLVVEMRHIWVYREDNFTNHIIKVSEFNPEHFYFYTGNLCLRKIQEGYCLKATLWAQIRWGRNKWSNQQVTVVYDG